MHDTDLPIKILKGSKSFCADYVAKYFNDSLKTEKFPN